MLLVLSCVHVFTKIIMPNIQPCRSATESFQQITTNHSRPLGKVLGTLLTKKYHQLTTEGVVDDWITLDVLLEWDLWPNYVKIVQQGKQMNVYSYD